MHLLPVQNHVCGNTQRVKDVLSRAPRGSLMIPMMLPPYLSLILSTIAFRRVLLRTFRPKSSSVGKFQVTNLTRKLTQRSGRMSSSG